MGFSLRFSEDEEEKRPFIGSWSAPALLGVCSILSLTVWSLPAVGLGNKLDLLRQSWHLNTVLDEGARLHAALEAAQKEKTHLQDEMEKEQARAVDLQRRLTVSDGQTRSLRTQLATEQGKRSTMQSANNDQQAQIDVQRKKRKDILHKLQALKRAELAQLAGLDTQAVAVAAQATFESNAAVGAESKKEGFAHPRRHDPRHDKSAEDKYDKLLSGMASAVQPCIDC